MKRLVRDQQGGMLVEAVVAVGLIAVVLTVAAQGLITGARGTVTVQERTAALNVARSQMAHTLAAPTYCAPPCAYETIPPPDGYTITSEAQKFEVPGEEEFTDLAYIVVTVSKDGQPLAKVRGIKVQP